MSFRYLLFAFVFLATVSFVAVNAKDYPNQPGTAHIDQFIPLDNDRVYVSDFTTVDFGASVLDFGSIQTSQPFKLNLPGGIQFETDSLNLGGSGAGPLSVSTSANNINFNSLGQTSFQGAGDVDVQAAAGDAFLRSIQGSLSFSSGQDSVFDSASIAVDARHSTGGVFFNAKGSLTSSSGVGATDQRQTGFSSNYLSVSGADLSLFTNNGSVEADSGANIHLSGQDTRVNPTGSLHMRSDIGGAFFQGSSVSFSAGGSLTVEAQAEVSLVSLGGSGSISSSQNINLQSTGTVNVNSFNGPVSLTSTSGSISVFSGEEVIVNAQGTMNLNSGQNIEFSANDAVNYFTVGDLTYAGATISLSSGYDLFIDSIDDIKIDSQSTLAFSSSAGSLTLEAGNRVLVESIVGTIGFTSPIQLFTSEFQTDVQALAISSTVTLGLQIDAIRALYISAQNNVDIQATSSFDMFSLFGVSLSAAHSILFSTSTIEFSGQQTTTFFSPNTLAVSNTGFSLNAALDLSIDTQSFVVSAGGTNSYQFADNFQYTTDGDSLIQAGSYSQSGLYQNVEAGGSGTFNTNTASLSAQNNLNLNATSQTTLSAPSGTFSIQSQQSLYGDFNGNVNWQSNEFDLTAQSASFKTRGDITISGGEQVVFNSEQQSINFHALGQASLSATSQFSLGGSNLAINANDGNQSPINLSASDGLQFLGGTTFVVNSGLDTYISAGDIQFNAAILSIQNPNNFLSDEASDFDMSFTSGVSTSFTAGATTISTQNGEFAVAATGNAALSSQGPLQVSLNSPFEDLNVLSNGVLYLNSTNGNIYGNGDQIQFNFANNISFVGEASLTLHSSNDIIATAVSQSNLEVSGNSIVQTNSFAASAANNINFSGNADLFLNSNSGTDIDFTAGGGGINWQSTDFTRFSAVGAIQSYSKQNLSLSSSSASSVMSSQGSTFHGGAISSTSVGSTSFTASGGILGSSGNNRFIEYDAAKNFSVSFVNNYVVNAYENISISAPYGSANTCVSLTQTGSPSTITFTGDNGISINAHSSNSSFISQSTVISATAVALSSYGFQKDPLHLIPLGVPDLGVILRTIHSGTPITINSQSAGIHVFAGTDIDAHSQNDLFVNVVQGDAEVLSSNYLATTQIFSAGSLFLNQGNNLNLVAGTSQTLADLYVNGTSIILNSVGASITQLGISSTGVQRQGILFDSKLGSIEFDNLLGGGITFETDTEKGSFYVVSINSGFVSNSEEFFAIADTGSIDVTALTAVSFNSVTVNVVSTTLDTIFNSTGGVGNIGVSSQQVVSLTAGNSLNLNTFQDLNILAGNSITTSSNTLGILSGGSVSIDGVTGHSLTATNNFIVDAGNEVSFEAQSMVFSYDGTPSSIVNIYASGDATQTGLAVSSLGGVLLQAGFNNSLISATSNFQGSNLHIQSNGFVHFTAGGGNPGSGDNMLLRATNANFFFNAALDLTLASNQTTSITCGVATFTSPFAFNFASNYLTSFKADNGPITYTVSSSFTAQSSNSFLIQSNNGSIAFTINGNIRLDAAGPFSSQSNTDTTFNAFNNININPQVASQEVTFQSGESFNVNSLTTNIDTQNLDWYATTSFTDTVTGTSTFTTFTTNFTTLGKNTYSAENFLFNADQGIFLNGATNNNLPLNFQGTSGITQTGKDIYFVPYNNLVDTAATTQSFTANNQFIANASLLYYVNAPTNIQFTADGSFSSSIYDTPVNYNALTPYITLTAPTMAITADLGSYSFQTLGSIVANFSSTLGVTATNGNLLFEANGGLGMTFNAASIDFGTTNSLLVQAYNGIDFLTPGYLDFSATQITFNASQSAIGNIYFTSGQGTSVTAGRHLFIYSNQTGYATNVEQGFIRFESPSLVISNALDFYVTSSRLSEFNADTLLKISASNNIEVDSGRTVTFSSPSNIQNAAGTNTFTAQTNQILSNIVFSSSSFSAVPNAGAAYTTAITTTLGNVEFTSAGATTIVGSTATSFSTKTGSLNIASQGGSVIFNSANGITAGGVANQGIIISTSGAAGSVLFNPNTLDLSTESSLDFEVGDTFVLSSLPSVSVTGASVFSSANNFHLYAGGGGLYVLGATGVSLRTVTHFDSDASIIGTAGSLNVLGNNYISINSEGNLGNIAARSVQGGKAPAINSNPAPSVPYVSPTYTDYAMEFYSVNGPVTLEGTNWIGLYSERGDVEFRSAAATRFDILPGVYVVAGDSGLLGFFGQNPAKFQQINIGGYFADYCTASNGCNAVSGCGYGYQILGLCSGFYYCVAYCPELSNAINYVYAAIFSYGLVGCLSGGVAGELCGNIYTNFHTTN